MPEFLHNGPQTGPRLILAHGAGLQMDSEFMTVFAELISEQGIGVQRFEFEYMANRRRTGKRAPPPAAERLVAEFQSAIDQSGAEAPYIGGKSLGGRVATMVAHDLFAQGRISGVIVLGYPFHPPDRPDALRIGHLQTYACPTLILQGENDPFGTRDEVSGYPLADCITVHYAPFGDHHLAPPKRSGRTAVENWRDAAEQIGKFVR